MCRVPLPQQPAADALQDTQREQGSPATQSRWRHGTGEDLLLQAAACGCVSAPCTWQGSPRRATSHRPGGGRRAERSLSHSLSLRAGCPLPHSFLSCREVNVQHRPKQPLLELLPWGARILTASRRQPLASDLSGRKVNQMRRIRFRLWAPRGPAVEREGPSEGPVWWPGGRRRPMRHGANRALSPLPLARPPPLGPAPASVSDHGRPPPHQPPVLQFRQVSHPEPCLLPKGQRHDRRHGPHPQSPGT